MSSLILPLVEKYRPKTRKDLIGNKKAIDNLYAFIENWNVNSKTKAVILVGPPGTGKTSAVLAVANDMGVEVVEFNSSDSRKKSDMESGLAPVTLFSSLSFDDPKPFSRIVLVDEVDGIHGNHDRGGVASLRKIIKESRFPLVLTANNIESRQVQSLGKDSRIIEFQRMGEFEIFELLEHIALSEGVEISEDQLQIIADSSAGDIRAAINELESYINSDRYHYIPPSRDRAKLMLDIINDVFGARTEDEARQALNRTTSEYFLLLNYMFDLADRECKDANEIYRTYKQIANADLYLQRISRTQNYSYLKYFFNFLSVGVFLSRQVRNRRKLSSITTLPQSLMARGRYKIMNKAALAIAPKVAAKLHIPQQRFVRDEFSYLVKSMRGKKGAYIAAWLDLLDDEIALILKINGDNSLMNYIEVAREEVGRERVKEGVNVSIDLDNFSMDKLIQDSLFEVSLAELNERKKKKKRKRTTRKSKKKIEKQDQTKKEEGTKEEMEDDEVKEETPAKAQTSLDDFF